MPTESELQNTRDEYRVFDMLPKPLRKFIREAIIDISARKVGARQLQNDHNTAKTLRQLKAWLPKELERRGIDVR